MAVDLNIENHDLKSIQKLFSDCGKTNIFYNSYTLLDIEENKNKVYLELLRKYNYQNKEYIQNFISNASSMLVNNLFESNNYGTSTQMVGIKDIIKDQRQLNKSHFNEYFRIISIDSMYRDNLWNTQMIYDSKTSTSMDITLSDQLDDVVSLELTNINIPFTFYNIDESYGNNYFYVEPSGGVLTKIEIPSGNYTNTSLIAAINTALDDTTTHANIEFALDATSNKTSIENTTGSDYTIIFYDHMDSNSSFASQNQSSLSNDTQAKMNNNLGWVLGFRNINYDVMTLEYSVANTATLNSEALCNVSYTKNFIIILDDFNKNQTNKGLVQISNEKEFMKRTTYYNNKDTSLNCLTNANFNSYVNEAGRKMSQKQLYSTLQINNHISNFKNKNSKIDAHGINNVFGIIPFESKSLVWGSSTFVSDKNRFKRKYNGPVDISKMQIKLLDDKGNIMNLNGCEWSMTLISTHLHQ
jgi:hypothetical protein